MADEITAAQIAEKALQPARATADGVSADQRSIGDLIRADQYIASKTAVGADPRKGCVFVKLVPPGAV